MTLRGPRFSRRRLLVAGFAIPIPFILGGCGDDDGNSTPTSASADPTRSGDATPDATATQPAAASPTATQLAPTPACVDDDEPTVAQTEGPYFTPDSPERTSLLEADITGTTLLLTGSVVSTSCQPVANALVDFWQCDHAGEYDNAGYRLRGHQFTDADGTYGLETIVPGLYPGRTRHIHVKVQAPDKPVLTTQLYFPGEARNQQDRIYAAECLIEEYRDAAGGKQGAFTFVLEL